MLAFTAGAAAVAAWVDVHLGPKAPKSLAGRVLLAALATLAVALAPLSNASPTAAYATIFGATFPAIVFAFVSAIWLMRALKGQTLA